MPEGGAAATTTGVGGQVVVRSVAYAQTKDALYDISAAGDAALIGPFEGCAGEVTDIAQSAEDELFAVTVDALYRVAIGPSASCEPAVNGAMPNSLTFLPAGVLGNEEVLVGFRERTYVRLDPVTKTVGILGDLGVAGLVSSGDLVWYAQRLFLSVSGEGCDDCLVQVDPITGAFQATTGDVMASSIFGLAATDDGLLGFLGNGDIVFLDPFTSSVEVVGELSLPWLGGTAR